MVYENESRWFAEDGQLTRRVCEDTSLAAPECCACDDAKYKVLLSVDVYHKLQTNVLRVVTANFLNICLTSISF